MHNFWTVIKLEMFLIWRSWVTWLIALAMIVIGVLIAGNNNIMPDYSWGQIVNLGIYPVLTLIFTTGNQVNRDRERRLDGVVFSTPIATPTYVLAKYAAALSSLLSLASLNLLGAILADQFYSIHKQVLVLSPTMYPVYPALGPQVYLLAWLWIILVPVIFGATCMLACTTMIQGKRAVAYIVTLLIWLLSALTIPRGSTLPFDITLAGFVPVSSPATNFADQHPMLSVNPASPIVQHLMSLSRAQIPPTPLLDSLIVNRLFFLGFSLILLVLTIYDTHVLRRHA